ncbi:MAG TPA: non-homologous end-joining DNA ligase [Marmoricola sp.]|nr:non-homologous end-joining DNA ligase [Marmoricola sp.]
MSTAPMLATRGDQVPAGDQWAHEVKWDGIRAIVDCHSGGGKVWTRTGRDISVAFPELTGLGCRQMTLDGEIVSLRDGVPTLQALADRIHVTDARKAALLANANPAVFLVFDVLSLDGRSLVSLPWSQRRTILESLGLGDVSWQTPPVYDDGDVLLEAARAQGLEGIVSKRRTSPYRPGLRSPDWLKFPIRPTGSFVVGGFRYETDSASRLGALLVGEPHGDTLAYRGKVGSGVAGKAGARLAEILYPLVVEECPFDDVPRLDAAGAAWVRPDVVIDVEYLAITTDLKLRQPAYRGVRADLGPADLLT